MRSSFKIVQVDDDRVFLVDLDIGCSVTNDAEAVRDYINQRYPGLRVIYRDTVDTWDELVPDIEGLFKSYNEYTPEVASNG